MNLILALVWPLLAGATLDSKNIVYKIRDGQNLQVQISKPTGRTTTTFLFLPGVNRGLLLEEPAAQELIKAGYGVVTFNFSVQPFSLVTLKSNQTAAFYNDEVTLETLAGETAKLAKALQTQYGLKTIIPVSLSYSGAVSRSLKDFAKVIDVVPLTSTDAFSPELAMYRNWLKSGELLNPIFGATNTRYWLDQAYSLQWNQQVDAITQQFNLPRERRTDMVDGYIRLSRATEGFAWDNRGDNTQRVFILAGNEAGALKRHQLQTVIERLKSNAKESVVVVSETGHVIPAEQPEQYAKLLIAAVTGTLKPGLTVVTPSSKKWETVEGKAALERLNKMAEGLPEVTGTRDNPGHSGIPGTL